MPIRFHEESKTFHLYNGQISYLMKVLPGGQLGQLYCGKVLHDRPDFDHLFECRPRPMSVCWSKEDDAYSLEHCRQEYAAYGTGDMHLPALDVRVPEGVALLDLQYRGYEILPGKPSLSGLPATYAEQVAEAETLRVDLADARSGVTVALFYTIFRDFAAIARHAEIGYTGTGTLELNCAMSLCLDLPDADYEMVELTGAWARERHIVRRPLAAGLQGVYSLRGCSSHHFNPFLALARPGCEETAGEVLGFSLVYSGNFAARADVDPYHVTRVTMGIHPQNFCWPLTAGRTFTTPEAVLVYSDAGFNGMSQTFHGLYRTRLARGQWRDRVRPILINNWEATYFDFNQEKLLPLAKKAKELGIELFVLDDGWFDHRDSDRGGLGDWEINYRKLPGGVKGFGEALEKLGIAFGLWIEPEMVSDDSRLWAEHPDWVLGLPDTCPHPGRHQYLLDMGNPAVVDYLFNRMESLLADAPVSYIKWDMNRSISDAYSRTRPAAEQGTVMHRYILGVYDLYERLTTRFPGILFESCASGGARFDPGMLYYAPQCWTSDDTDAVERMKIQYGTSMVYPICSMAAHVSAVPNHQMGRVTPMSTRSAVALFGTLGYELDLNRLSEEELADIAEQVAFAKQWRQVVQYGTFWRLKSPFQGNEMAWMTVSQDKNTALVGVYRVLQEPNAGFRRVRLAGLDPDRLYRVTAPDGTARCHYGDELMQAGLVTSDASCGENTTGEGDFIARLYRVEAVEE